MEQNNKSNGDNILLLNQEEGTSDKKKKPRRHLWERSLLLKQTLIAAWKAKLQLVILLLLTAFATSLVTGAWISYQRILSGKEALQLDDANFDAVLPIGNQSGTQIANQAFSLTLGKLFYQEEGSDSVAVYFDNSIIGKEIQPLRASDLKITYLKEDGVITGISDFQWANPSHPLDFDLNNINVEASLYGQLYKKANETTNQILKNNYLQAAKDLYNNLFVSKTAGQILDSLKKYFADSIVKNAGHPYLKDETEFTNAVISSKINYRGSDVEKDLRIPNEVELPRQIDVLTNLIKKEDEEDPRVTSFDQNDYGMNGQWMRIYRKFDMTSTPDPSVIKDFSNQYQSPSNYNMLTDGSNPNIFSVYFAQAAAALQNRSVQVVNQYVATAGTSSTGKSTTVKVVNIGLAKNYNQVNLKVFEGIFPSSKNEIVISPQYARTYGIRPGNTININNRVFIVTGIGGDAFNIYPIINSLDPLPNTRNEFIAYALPDAFYDGDWVAGKDKTDISLMYFIPWKNVPVTSFDTPYLNDYYQRTIFADNKINDHSQDDYNKYLVQKYVRNNPDYPSKYTLSQNLVAVEGDSQFDVYARGRLMLASILQGFKYVAYIGVIFLLLIVIFITYLIIKKAIQKGQVSMGILKSAGYSTWSIISSYLAYPLIVLLIGIPVGWFVGLAIQVYFTEIFNAMFILPYNVLSFNFIPFLISVALICGFVLITTLITSWKMLQKEPLMLMKKDSDIASNSNQSGSGSGKLKNKFKLRFLLSLSKTSWKKITVTSIVIAVATLAITATVSVPATINNMKDNYFKTQKYKNYYQYQTPISNMPLSKYGLYTWNNLVNKNDDPFYPVYGNMPWVEDIVINNASGTKLGWYNPLDYKQTGANDSNFSDIVKFYAGVDPAEQQKIIDQFKAELLKRPNGPLDLNFLSWSYSWMGGRMFSNQLIKDLAELDQSKDKVFSSSLIAFATVVLPGILNVTNPGVPPGPDAIVEILKQTLPGFIRQALDSKEHAYDYFAIGHNTVAYNPNYNSEVGGAEEELVTQFQLGSADSNLVNKGFLDVEGINPDTKMLVMDKTLVQKMKYNSTANIVPMVVNRSFAAKYNLRVGSQFSAHPKVRTLFYKKKDGSFVPMPKQNWYYGENPFEAADPAGTKSIWEKSASRWNARGTKPVSNTDYSDTHGYRYSGIYDRNGHINPPEEPEQWNDLNKVWLKLPTDIVASVEKGTLRSHDGSKNLSFKIDNIGKKDADGNWWIQPFSFQVADDYHGKEIDPTELLLTRVPEWYGAMLDQENLLVDDSLHEGNLTNEIEKEMPTWWENIVGTQPITNYQIVGIHDSYDTARAYIDQKWANSIVGYSHFNDRSDNKDPLAAPGIYQWFSGKLSASDDIYDIVGRMAFKRSGDDYNIYAMSGLRGNVEEPIIANSDLLLRKKEMLTKMAEIALSASLLFIVTTIICSILIVIMITDSFTEQFRFFMAHMKAEGYANKEINSFTLGIFTPWAFLGYALGYGLGFLVVYGFVQAVSRLAGLAFPFAFIWWIIPLSFGIIALIYFSTYIINNAQLNRMDLIALLKSDE